MSRLRADKLHVKLGPFVSDEGPITPRSYTLTHSDFTGDLFLTIDAVYDEEQISSLYTRLMRDEVLAEWRTDERPPALHVHCHVSDGFTLGPARLRLAIFKRELPLVLEALRFGDRHFFAAHPGLDEASIFVHFHAKEPRYDRVEAWGAPADYRIPVRDSVLPHLDGKGTAEKGV
jgi:hypothetical protein